MAYLKFYANRSTVASTISCKWQNDGKLWYRTAGSEDEWTELPQETVVPVTKAGIELKGNINKPYFTMTGSIAARGDITALLNEVGGDCTLTDACLNGVFSNNSALTEGPDFPATVMATNCYYGAFMNCTSLIKCPELPSLKLAGSCYAYMFAGCTSLERPCQYLMATHISDYAYANMFMDCTKLRTVPITIAGATMEKYAYIHMFERCSRIVGYSTPTPGYEVKHMYPYSEASNWCTHMYEGISPKSTVPATPLPNTYYYFEGTPDPVELNAQNFHCIGCDPRDI